jgi:hypothetical protein
VYFPIAGSTFVGIYTLPSFKYHDWQLLAAIPLGLAAGALALITVVAIGLLTKLTAPLATRTVLRATIGGIAFGLVGVALPLTLFTGTDQLTTVIRDGAVRAGSRAELSIDGVRLGLDGVAGHAEYGRDRAKRSVAGQEPQHSQLGSADRCRL